MPLSEIPGIEHSSLMVLDHSGDLICLRLKGSYVSKKITYGHISKFDDIVIKKGMVMVVDRLGRLYRIEYKRMETTMVCVAVSMFKGYGERRKRLLWDSGTRKLYLVVREHVMEGTKFKVYVHNSLEGVWDELSSFGNRVLFVSCDSCFFVQAADLPGFKGNCIVFPKDCFPAYSGTNNPDGTLFQGAECKQFFEVGVHNYGEGENFKLISDCPGFSDALWPPPQWIWEDTPTTYVESAEQVEDLSSEFEKEKSQANEVKTELCSRMNEEQQSLVEDGGTAYALWLGKSSLELETHTHSKDIPDSTRLSALQLPAECRTTCTANYQVHEEDLEVETPGETHSDSPDGASNTFLTQALGSNDSKVTFEGVNIRSDLVPTLENIWAKHGNIIGGSAIRNGDIIARALESLAMVVQILQGSSGRSLDKCQADYMSSALRDLQFMHFSVEWLVPFVEKALAVHKSRPLLDSLLKINKTKTQATERRLKLLDELAKVDELEKELEEEGTLVRERIPISALLDLDECLGKGLC